MKKELIKNYLPGGNTPQGFYSFYSYLPQKAEEVFIIKGGPGTGKSTFMKRIAEKAIDKELDVELHWCSSDNNSLDGVVIPSRKIAMLDGTAPHMTDPVYPGVLEEILNFGEYWDKKHLQKYKKEIIKLTKEISSNFKMAYLYLGMAKKPFIKEKSYIQDSINKTKFKELADQLIETVFNSLRTDNKTSGIERHLFGTGITPEGHINYLEQPGVRDTYLLEGPAGSGKSKIINQIGQTALQNGVNVLFLHCSFEPEELDGVIINSGNSHKIAVLDSSEPHSIEKANKEVFKTEDILCKEKYNQKVDSRIKLKKIYREMMDNAFNHLAQAKAKHDELEEYYIKAMDFTGIENMRKELENNIF